LEKVDVSVLCASITVITTCAWMLYRAYESWLNHRPVVIGVLSFDDIVGELASVPNFTSYRRARHANAKVVFLHCRTMSYALDHCDFVINHKDPKFLDLTKPLRFEGAVTVGLMSGLPVPDKLRKLPQLSLKEAKHVSDPAVVRDPSYAQLLRHCTFVVPAITHQILLPGQTVDVVTSQYHSGTSLEAL